MASRAGLVDANLRLLVGLLYLPWNKTPSKISHLVHYSPRLTVRTS